MSFKPIFENGLILKQHMLEALRDYPLDYVSITFSGMGDGVITGLDVVIGEEDSFFLSEGIEKIDGNIYLVNQSEQMTFKEQENFVYLKIVKTEEIDGISYGTEVVQKNEEDSSLFEVFRYVKNGEVKKYVSIDEVFSDVTNRVNQRKMKKSIQGGSTLNDEYYRLFSKCLLKSKCAQVKDIAFAYQCLNSITNVEILKEYFGVEDLSNDNLLSLMEEIASKMRSSAVEDKKEEPKPEKKRPIYVD